MKKRKLGRTGLEVSELGFGAWAIGGTSYGPTDDRQSRRALAHAYDQGINFFDTADTYGHGHSEQLIGEAFRMSSKRSRIVIATKVGWDFYHGGSRKNFDSEYLVFACGESLKRLQMDYIDLYQLHNPTLAAIREGTVFKVLRQLKKEGKIRFWGVSIHSSEEGMAVIREGSSDTLQAVYHLIDQRHRSELMPACQKENVGLIVREPLHCGMLTGKYNAQSQFVKTDHRSGWGEDQLELDFRKIDLIRTAFDEKKVSLKQAAIEFVLGEQAVSSVIPGMKTVAHVEDHLSAVRSPKLKADEINRIKSIFDQEKIFQTDLVAG
ncbi:MAG: hypothetical protein A3A73_01115 [Omnitrophica bacterium RIFCSPLOWO2_01_FULL_50_24]|nr:MAG: hypothetical protein A3A73_01115 [Omnitrophica bacterium RIFCSPLOWO2_01_FULL_50_24]